MLFHGPDAEGERARFERFVAQGGRIPDDGDGRALLQALLTSGTFLPDLLLADPTQLDALTADPWLRRAKPREVVAAEVVAEAASATDRGALKAALRRVRRREMLRLGARELGWGTTEEVARELSGLADACLDAAVAFCSRELSSEMGVPECDDGKASFVVIAMGKLGGEELNFCSDIDVCYFYSSDAGRAGRHTLHEYYVALSERITAAIEEPTADGFVFRVDLRLRPEGRSGAICNSVAAAERYYETFGRTWERQALLRARPAAGDLALGHEILQMLEPFTYPRSLDGGTVGEIRRLRGLFRAQASVGDGSFDVKLGGGGIRDVELVAQTLQLLHAGKRRDLRARATPQALHSLLVAGLVSNREERALIAAYRFWRRLEHRIQIENGSQTHTLAGDARARELMARRMGLRDAVELGNLVARHRAEVERIAATFADPDSASGARPEIVRLLDPVATREQVEADLAALGFAQIEASADVLDLARARLLPVIIGEAAASPDPDRALARFGDLALHGSAGLRALLRDDPQLVRMLATLFGTSEHLSRLLLAHPETWEPFVEGLGEPRRSAETLRRNLAARLPGLPEEDALAEMRRFQAEEILRVGLHDVAGSIEPHEVSAQLGDVAEICIDRALVLVAAPLEARHGIPDAELTVLALGSLGAREMRYGSDLDLVFLYSRDGTTTSGMEHQEWYARLAQRLIGALGALMQEGRLYQVDTRLRPSGAQGMLVTSYDSFVRYHEQQAAPWERVALLRARIVSGNTDPGGFAATLERTAYAAWADDTALREALVTMRARIESERRRVEPGARHIRFDPGGLTDIEFVAALGQIRLGHDDPSLRTTSVEAALVGLAARARPSEAAAATLIDDYRALRIIALRLRLCSDRPEDVIRPADLGPLARTFGRSPEDLGADLDRRMARVRAIFATTLST